MIKRASCLAAVAAAFVMGAFGEPKRVTTSQELVDAFASLQEGDIIEIASGDYQLTGELQINKNDVTVRGIGATKPVIDCQDVCRAFYVPTAIQNPLVENLTIINGNVSETAPDKDGGGGVYVYRSVAKIKDCEFRNCRGYNGGGVSFYDHVDTEGGEVVGCRFEGNVAVMAGGGLYARKITVQDCVFTNNKARAEEIQHNGNGGGGLAFSIYGTGGVVSGCHFFDNCGPTCEGGAIYGPAEVISNCVFRRCISGMRGGAYSNNRDATPQIVDCVFEDCATTNTAKTPGGGAVYVEKPFPLLARCRFRRCFSPTYGGALLIGVNSVSGSGLERMVDCEFTGNYAQYGGAMLGEVKEMERCAFTNNCARRFGAAWAFNAPSTTFAGQKHPIRDTEFYRNFIDGTNPDGTRSGYGASEMLGGAAISLSKNLTGLDFQSCRFVGNICTNIVRTGSSCPPMGGAIFVFNVNYGAPENGVTDAHFADCVFRENAVYSGGMGGAFYGCVTGGFDRCVFAGNIASTFQATNSTLTNLGWEPALGAVAVINRSSNTFDSTNRWSRFRNCTFTNNVCRGGGGSALYMCTGGLELKDCLFADNELTNHIEMLGATKASTRGGMINFAAFSDKQRAFADIDRCRFVRNRGVAHGTVLTVFSDYNPTTGWVRNSLFADNVAVDNCYASARRGGAVFYGTARPGTGGTFALENCTFADNAAWGKGGGLSVDFADSAKVVQVRNCVFSGNRDTQTSHKTWNLDFSVAPVTPVSFCFERKDTDNYLADGVNNCLVKDQDPFCADDRTTYAVAKGCGRGAAEVLGWMEGALDLGCKPRTTKTDDGEVVADMGCYQFWRRPGMFLFLR